MAQERKKLRLDALLLQAGEMGADDIHIQANSPPLFRVAGELRVHHNALATEEAVADLLHTLLEPQQQKELTEQGSVRWVHWSEQHGRVKGQASCWSGGTTLTLRPLPDFPPKMVNQGWDSRVIELIRGPGLVLMTGEANSGLSSSLHSLVDVVNASFRQHILCLELQMEYLQPHKLSIMNQRLFGQDFHCWKQAIKDASFQEVDTLVLHDAPLEEVWELLSDFLDSGALVLLNVQARSARQALESLIDAHPPAHQERVRLQLSRHLSGVTHQRLVAGHLASSLLNSTLAIGNLFREGKFHQLYQAMSRSEWCYTLEQSLFYLFQEGMLTREQALSAADRPEALHELLQGVAP